MKKLGRLLWIGDGLDAVWELCQPLLSDAGVRLLVQPQPQPVTESLLAVVVVVDQVKHPDPFAWLLACRSFWPDQVPVVVLAPALAPYQIVQITRLGVLDVILHEQAERELPELLQQVINRYQASAVPDQALVGIDTSVVGASPCMDGVFYALGVAARNDLNLLITGETGTGKEFAARMVHRHSARADSPFVPINCTALPAELLEAELFGHASGAYTGAVRQRVGFFEAAAGGALLLDEIGDLPLELQPKLLHFLERKELCRLGESKMRQVDVRIIAATHRNLLQAVQAGRFREDLYYRLTQMHVQLPPLRERQEDLELLLQGFIDEFNHTLALNITSYSHEVREQLREYSWPGNVRELRHVVNRAVLQVRNGVLDSLPLRPASSELAEAELV